MKGKKQIIGYIRVSTNKQDVNNQKSRIREYAEQSNFIITEYVQEIKSSRKKDRAIYSVKDKLKEGDTLVVYELSRIGRSMREIYTIINELRDKNVTIHVIERDLVIESGFDVKTEAIIFALSIGAELERELISERTKNALRAKKEQGIKLGRPIGKSILDDREKEIKKYLNLGLSITAIAKLLEVHRHTVRKFVKEKNLLSD